MVAARMAPVRVAFLLGGDAVGPGQVGLGEGANLAAQGLVPGRRGPVPRLGAGLAGECVDGLDGDQHLIVTEDHGAEHDLFRQLLGLGLDHHHGIAGAGDHQIEPGGLQRGAAGVDDVIAIHVADAHGADRPVERHARQAQRGGGAEHGRDVGGHVRVIGMHHGDDLDFVVEAFRKQRAQGTVDQARGEDLMLLGLTLALAEAAGDAAGGVVALLVIDGQGEEILPRARFLFRHHGDEDDGITHADHDGAAGLAGDLAGFEGDGVAAVLEGLGGGLDHDVFPCVRVFWPAKHDVRQVSNSMKALDNRPTPSWGD